MNIEIEYRRQRVLGWTACHALRHVRTLQQWRPLENKGLVRLNIIADEDIYDDSYIDTWGIRDCEKERIRKEIWDRIECEGVWDLIGEYLDADGEWQSADSCCGFIGEDWRESGYDYDIMDETINRAKQVAKFRQFAEHYL